MYKGTWQNSSTQVKVHNSFSYTEDIKYEVRVLEMPTNDADVGLVIIVPNETDVLDQLVTKLHRDGLSSAISSIQPSFTATCKQTLPTFAFNSAIAMRDDDHKRLSISQYGEVKVDQGGVDIKVLTCLPIGNENVTDYETAVISNKCFNFAIVCKDVPLFTGQVLP
ncbi:serpin B4-like [Battus philenor]|uniref:serpin B4-like n=1 Tax=Battus philenor TaxID=42288 RepID=UPI0035D06293